jgi:hypothetical protein
VINEDRILADRFSSISILEKQAQEERAIQLVAIVLCSAQCVLMQVEWGTLTKTSDSYAARGVCACVLERRSFYFSSLFIAFLIRFPFVSAVVRINGFYN